jgi:DNA-binding transcriptional ArsR family regulator
MAAMTADVRELARVAGLLADRTRAAFCMALIDGRAWTANELARHAGVAPSTASEQLSKLVSGGLLVEHRQGRHRYLALAGPHVAELLEDLSGRLAPPEEPPGTTLKAATTSAAMRRGRTCYDHLAGVLGVALADAMTSAGLIRQDTGFALTDPGLAWFARELDITDLDQPTPGRRPLARGCLDWTQRRPHLAGVAGARLCTRFFERNWLTRIGTSRAVRVTPAGRVAVREMLAIELD